MGVEILILSGSRQGQQLELDVDEFRAGGDGSCDVFFDPADDADAVGRAALFQRTDEGWCIRNVGTGELLLNQQPVSGRARIRSGDIVRLSESGPDFSFEITTGRELTQAGSAVQERAATVEHGQMPASIEADDVLQSGVRAESILPAIVPPRRPRKPTVLIAAALGAGVLTLAGLFTLVLFGLGENAEPPDAVSDNAAVSSAGPLAGVVDVVEPPVDNVADNAATTSAQNDKPKPNTENVPPDATPKDPWEAIARRHAKTIWLLRVGDADDKFVYPYATAFAVGGHTLLTTASVAEELDKFRAKGWKITAVNAAAQKTVPIWKIRMHAIFPAFAKSREKQIYVDVAVLETVQRLGPAVTPASEAELAELDTGSELACMGIAHGGDAMKAEDAARPGSLPPRLFRGKLFLKTRLDPKSPAGPRLLHLKASLGENMQGSPIFNRRGNVVAVHAEAAAGEGHRLGLHYAPILNPALIQRAVDGKYEKFWVPPARKKIEDRGQRAEDRRQRTGSRDQVEAR